VNASQAYRTLDVDSKSSFDEVKIAYRKLALELHPDKNTKKTDGKEFKKITEAYNLLKDQKTKSLTQNNSKKWEYSDPQTKKKYDFGKKKPKWSAPQDKKPPEQDWGKYTKDFEGDPKWWKEYERKFWKEYDSKMGTGTQEEFEKTKDPKVKPNLFVDVDPSLCIACCSCETIAPEVFEIDKSTKMNPKSHVINPKGAGFNKIMNAAETCPTKAIIVENKDTKERFYPL